MQRQPDVDDDKSGRDFVGDVQLSERKHDSCYRKLRFNIGLSALQQSDVLPLQQRPASGDECGLSELCFGDKLERKHMSGAVVGDSDACISVVQHRGGSEQLQCQPDVDDDKSRGNLLGDVELPKREYDGGHRKLRFNISLSAL